MRMHSSVSNKSRHWRGACIGNYEPSPVFLSRLHEALRNDPVTPRDLSPSELRVVAKDLVAAFSAVILD